MPVGELLERISSREISEWIAYDQVEPIGDTRGDLRMAVLASVLANVHRDPDQHPEPFGILEWMPDYWRRREPQPDPVESWQRNLALAEIITVAMGGQDLRQKI